ncbi:MAG: class I SAM-dependent methyltransferase [Actinomycetia bacterium]|nr:class I SAM-dependent methyltransferase [Actinomycetes bacterium]
MEETSRDDRSYWNQRYSDQPWPDEPSPWLIHNAGLLPSPGAALDIAGGTGRNALWLAEHGWELTIVDVSDVALALATDSARGLDVRLTTVLSDLSADDLPSGPWNLVMLFHYLERNLFPEIEAILQPGGIVIGSLATTTNLERNTRPPLPYLLEEGELPSLIGKLEMLEYEEGWLSDRHDARFVARHSVPPISGAREPHTRDS